MRWRSALGAAVAGADVVVLLNGDQITGRVVGSVAKRVRLQTPYGVLVIPAEKVERIQRDDGSEEVLSRARRARRPRRPRRPAPATLLLVVTGASFWHAWDPKSAPEDPSLRLELRLDERVARDLHRREPRPGGPAEGGRELVRVLARAAVRERRRGRHGRPALARRVGDPARAPLPPALAGERRLRLAYQLNDAGSAAPRWRDVVVAGAPVTLVAGRSARVRVQQDRGTMEYARKGLRGPGQMRGVETFRATLEVEPAP